MVKHIVMFRLKEKLEESTKRMAMHNFKDGIERLPEVIPFIKSVYVGFNINEAEQWDICLESTFSSLEEVKAYSIHPSHVAVASALKPYVEQRACVDFEE